MVPALVGTKLLLDGHVDAITSNAYKNLSCIFRNTSFSNKKTLLVVRTQTLQSANNLYPKNNEAQIDSPA